jgi:hypothetical protein
MDLLGAYDEEDDGSDKQASPTAQGVGDAAVDAELGAEPAPADDVASDGAPSDASSPLEDGAQAPQPPAAAPTGSGPELPPAPPGPVSETVLGGVEKLLAERKKGTNLNEQLQDKKEFHNPGILERLVSEFKIMESGTNYSADMFSPVYDCRELYYDSLKRQAERRDEQARATRTAIGFESGGVQQPDYPARAVHAAGLITNAPSAVAAASAAAALALAHGVSISVSQPAQTAPTTESDGPAKKKSKWDTATKASNSAPLPPVSLMPSVLRPGVLLQQQQLQLMMQYQQQQQQQQLVYGGRNSAASDAPKR